VAETVIDEVPESKEEKLAKAEKNEPVKEVKTKVPTEKAPKIKKEIIISQQPNDSVLPDDIVDGKNHDGSSGQLTLF